MSALRRKVMTPAAALLLPAYLSACFHYVPASTDPLPGPQSDVRVGLTSPIDVPLGEVTLHDVTTVEGVVARSGTDSLSVFARWLYPQLGTKYDALGATFDFPKSSIARVEAYRLSPKLTVGAGLIAGAVLMAFLEAIHLAVGGQDSNGGQPQPQASVRGGWGIP
jgi:hypothetical protein